MEKPSDSIFIFKLKIYQNLLQKNIPITKPSLLIILHWNFTTRRISMILVALW